MTKREKKAVLGIFETLLANPYYKLTDDLGCITIEYMYDICRKIKKELNIDGEYEQ